MPYFTREPEPVLIVTQEFLYLSKPRETVILKQYNRFDAAFRKNDSKD